jgi:hypothetical protein
MSANISLVHDDPRFIEEAAAALRTAGHDVSTFRTRSMLSTRLKPRRASKFWSYACSLFPDDRMAWRYPIWRE